MTCPSALDRLLACRTLLTLEGHYCCKCGTSVIHLHKNPDYRCPNRHCHHPARTSNHSPSQCNECVKRSFTERPVWTCWACGILNPVTFSRITGLPRTRRGQTCVDRSCGYVLNEACVVRWDRHGVNVGTSIVDEFDQMEVKRWNYERPATEKRMQKHVQLVKAVDEPVPGILDLVVAAVGRGVVRWVVPVLGGVAIAAWFVIAQ